MAFATIIVFFPSVPGPNANEMNYATVVLGGVLALAIIYYFFPRYGGKYWFQGPLGAVRKLESEMRPEERSIDDASMEKKASSIEKVRDVTYDE